MLLRGDIILNKKFFLLIFLFFLLSEVYSNPQENYIISTGKNYTIETLEGYLIKIKFEKVENVGNIIDFTARIENVNGPFILICRIVPDEEFNWIKIDNPKFESKIEGKKQVLLAKISVNLTKDKKEIEEIPLYISGIYSGCEGGCDSFLIGPFILKSQINTKIKIYYYLAFGVLSILILSFLLFKNYHKL